MERNRGTAPYSKVHSTLGQQKHKRVSHWLTHCRNEYPNHVAETRLDLGIYHRGACVINDKDPL